MKRNRTLSALKHICCVINGSAESWEIKKKKKCHYIAMELLATKPIAFWLMAVRLHERRLIHETKLVSEGRKEVQWVGPNFETPKKTESAYTDKE